jgi:predicted TIM-barrel fold metal-dependent hydrolase
MKKSGITRRDFMKGLSVGALSTAIIPSWAVEHSKIEGSLTVDGMSDQSEVNLPPLFDCNKYIGPGFPKRPDFPKVVDLIAHMDKLGIDRAVAWHTTARFLDTMKGNEQLISELKSVNANERIIPSFIISPSFITDKQSFNLFLSLAEKHKIRAFHFFPGKSGVKLKDIYPVIKTLQSFKPVLFLDSFENLGDDLEMIKSFSGEFPKVSIIFTNAMWGHLDRLYKLMEARPNIFMDTSLQHIYQANEYIIRRFGVERLIFGTGYKSNNGASIAALAHAEITPDQFQLIAHVNLERLLGIRAPLTGSRPIIGERLWHRLLRRESLGNDFIDAHTHLCRTTAVWEDHDQTDIDSHAKQAIRQMDKLGIRSMIVAEYTVYPPDLSEEKTFIEKHLDKYGDRFHGYFSGLAFKTEKNDLGKLLKRMDDLFSRSYYVGFKMHNSHWNIPVTDPDFTPIWEYANKRRLPILLHTWNDKVDAPKMLTEIVPRYPNAIFILGHSGNTDRHDAEMLALENPNVYLEWCGSFVNPDDWRETLERLGNRRILYGSDFISWEARWGHDPVWEMGRLLSLDVPDETLLPILGSNMRGILEKRR